MDDKLNEKNYLNNDILIESENINKNSMYIINQSKNKRNINLKFNPKFSEISQKGKYSNHSFTERKYKIQEYKENINNNGNDENRKFIRLKKGLHFRIKNKTLRNNNDNNMNKEAICNQKNQNYENNNLFQKEIGRKSDVLTHSYSYDYLNLNSDLGFKFKLPFQNSKMLSQNFVKGMKNQKRKLDLINAIEKYNKYKTLFASKSERQFQSNNNLDNINYNEYNEYEKESVEKRKEQINRIKIQNIINFRKVYESIQNRKDMKYKPRKTDFGQEKNHKEIFVRKILREEKYTIGDDGQEKILEINQSYLPNKVNIDSFNNFSNKENETKLISIKEKENLRQIPITNEKIINDNNEKNNSIIQKRRSYQNFNKDINEYKNKIFIKKHPTNLKINVSSKLINKKQFVNQRSINKNLNSNYIILDNHNRNHSYREIKNLTENNISQKYSNNSNYTNFDKIHETKNNNLSNKNICMTNYIANNQKIDIKMNKYKIYTNRIRSSKGYTNNNFIHEIINKENKIEPKQFIMFNLNNFNNSNKNQNNNVITIYTSPNYK